MSQMDYVCGRITRFGKVSRNQCLKMGITRLPSYINRLKNKGYKFVRVDDGKDVVYWVKK